MRSGKTCMWCLLEFWSWKSFSIKAYVMLTRPVSGAVGDSAEQVPHSAIYSSLPTLQPTLLATACCSGERKAVPDHLTAKGARRQHSLSCTLFLSHRRRRERNRVHARSLAHYTSAPALSSGDFGTSTCKLKSGSGSSQTGHLWGDARSHDDLTCNVWETPVSHR